MSHFRHLRDHWVSNKLIVIDNSASKIRRTRRMCTQNNLEIGPESHYNSAKAYFDSLNSVLKLSFWLRISESYIFVHDLIQFRPEIDLFELRDVSFLFRIWLSRRCLMCSEPLFIPYFEFFKIHYFHIHFLASRGPESGLQITFYS